MTTTTPEPTTWKRWTHFWFAPVDPTAMAFIRVVTGLLVLYTHLAYCFDLTAFFGKDAWYSQDAINRERREAPWTSRSFADGWKWWEETARLPEEPHRRAAILAYIRALPADRPGLEKRLAILAVKDLDPVGYPSAIGQQSALFANGLSADPKVRAGTLKALADPALRDAKEQFPPAFEGLLDPAHKEDPHWALKRLAVDLEEFYWTLPGYSDDLVKAAMPFMFALPKDATARAEVLKAVAEFDPRKPDPRVPVEFSHLFDTTRPQSPELSNRYLRRLSSELAEVAVAVPDAPRLATETEAEWEAKVRAACEATWKRKQLAVLDARKYVTGYLVELNEVSRYNFLRFVRDLAGDPNTREEKLDYFSYWHVEKRHAGSTGYPIFSLWFHISDPTSMAIAHGVMMMIMLMFTLGLFTRTTAVLTWLCCVSYIHRNQQVLFGQDTMMNILLIYLMVADCGATLSLDRLIARYRAAKLSLARSGTIDGPTAAFLAQPRFSAVTGFAQRLLQIHFCFIYMAAGLSKLKGADWWNTGAFWSTTGNPEFTMLYYQWYQDLLRAMFTHRWIYATSAAFVVGFTLFVEISLPYLVWTKLRPHIMIAGMLMHFGIGMFMGLMIFSLLMMTMLCSYLPGTVIRRQLFGPPPTEKVKRIVDVNNTADLKRTAWAVARDSLGKIEVVKK